MTDIVERLRRMARIQFAQYDHDAINEAADQIEGLRDEIRNAYRDRDEASRDWEQAMRRVTELEERLTSAHGAVRSFKQTVTRAESHAIGCESLMYEMVNAVDQSKTLEEAKIAAERVYRSERRQGDMPIAMRGGAPDEFADVMRAVFAEMEVRDGHRGNAPGHAHEVPGIWDDDNGELAGQPCAWCALWNKAKAMLAATPAAQEE